MALVFQYGSNCSAARINSRDRLNGDAVLLGRAELEGFRLVFDVWSDGNNCAAADIVEVPASTVQGVLYEIPDNLISRTTTPLRRKSFDAIEGRRYERRQVRVKRRDGSVVNAITYVARQSEREGNIQTSLEYVTYIVLGLRENAADEEYIGMVKEIAQENNPAIATQVRAL